MEIVLDGRHWQTEADVFEAVLASVDAPSWHGRNYNALRDSFVTGSINGIEPPYDFTIRILPDAPPGVVEEVRYFIARICEWSAEGAQLSVRLG